MIVERVLGIPRDNGLPEGEKDCDRVPPRGVAAPLGNNVSSNLSKTNSFMKWKLEA